MSNTPIQVIVQIVADAKLQGATKQMQQLGNLGQKVGDDIAASFKKAEAAQKAATASAKASAKAAGTSAKASASAASANKDHAATTRQLVTSNRLLANAWRENTSVVDNHYLKSMRGLREAFRKFNTEAKTSVVLHKGVAKTLDDSSLKMQRFMMKANLASRTFEHMAVNLQNVGKNAQWTGRQMMVGITAPIAAIAALSFKSAMEIGKVELQLKKLVDQGQGLKEVAKDMEYLDSQSKALSGGGLFEGKMQEGFGKTRAEIKEIQGIFAQIGFKNKDITELTEATVQFAALGDIDTSKAAEVVRVLRQGGVVGNELTNTLAKFNMIEDQTNLSMQDIAESFPKIYPLTKQLGASATETAALLSGITQAGFPAAEAANALRAAYTKLAPALALVGQENSGNRLKALKDTFEEINKTTGLGLSFNDPATGKMRDAVDMTGQLAQAYQVLNSEQGDLITGQEQAVTLIRNMFGGERSGQGVALLEAMSKSMDQNTASGQDMAKAMGIARDESTAAMVNWKKQIGIVLDDPTVKFQSQVQKLINAGQDLGKKLIPIATKVLGKINDLVTKFEGLSEGTKKKILLFVGALALIGPAVYIYGQSLILLGTIAKGITKPFALFFGMRSRFADMAQGVNPLIDKLQDLTAEFETTGDRSLLPKIEKTIQELEGKRIASTEAQTKATEANTAAQEALNTARAEGAMIDDDGGLVGAPDASGSGLYGDDYVDTELAKRMDARKKKAIDAKTKQLINEDRGRVVTKKRILGGPKKAEKIELKLQKKVDDAQDILDSYGDDSIDALARGMAESDIGVAPDLSAVEASKKRILDMRSRVEVFEKEWGIKSPIAPNLAIKDSGDRFADFEKRWNMFEESISETVAGIAGRTGQSADNVLGEFKKSSNGEFGLEGLHQLVKDAMDEANGKVRPELGDDKTGKKAAREVLQNALADVDTDAPPLMNDRVVDQIRQGLQDGVMKPDADMLGSSIDDAVLEALNDPQGWEAWVKKNKTGKKGARGGDVEKIINSFIAREFGGKASGLSRKKNALGKLQEKLAEAVKSGDASALHKAGDLQRAIDAPALWKELQEIETSTGGKNNNLSAERKKRRDEIRATLSRVDEVFGEVAEDGSEEQAMLKKELAATKKSAGYKKAVADRKKVNKLRKQVRDTEVQVAEEAAKLNEEIKRGFRDPGHGRRNPRLGSSKSGVAARVEKDTLDLLNETEIGPSSAAGKGYIDKKIKTAVPGKAFLAELLPEDTTSIRDEIGGLTAFMKAQTGVDPTGKNISTKVLAEWRGEFDKHVDTVRLENIAKNKAIRENVGERKNAYVRDWVKRHAAGEVAQGEGMPDDLKKALAAAMFGGMEEGSIATGGGRGRKKGYRALIREALGEAAHTPLEDEALAIINDMAADMSQSVPSATKQDVDTFRKRADNNRTRATPRRSKFAGGLGSRLRKKGPEAEAEVRAQMLKDVEAELAKIDSHVSADTSRLTSLTKDLESISVKEGEINSKFDNKLAEEMEKVESDAERKRQARADKRDADLKKIGNKGAGVKKQRQSVKNTYQAHADSIEKEKQAELQRVQDFVADERRQALSGTRLERTVKTGEVDRAESRLGKSTARKEGAETAKRNILSRNAEPLDYFNDQVSRKERQLKADQSKVDDTIKKINGLKKREAAQIRRIKKDVEKKLKAMPTRGAGSMKARDAVREAGQARIAAAKDKNAPLFQILKEQFTDQANRANVTRGQVEEVKRLISVGGTDDLAVLNQALAESRDEAGRFKGGKAAGGRTKAKNLSRLVGSLSPEMAQTIEEFMVADTAGTYDDALKIVRNYHPDISDDLASEYAGKVVDVRNAMENQFAESRHYLGKGGTKLNRREQMRVGRRGRATTLDNRGSGADLDEERAAGNLSFDDAINEEARRGSGGTPSGTSKEDMVDDLVSGFARQREEDAEKLARSHEAAKKKLRISENRIEELRQEEAEELENLKGMDQNSRKRDRQKMLIDDIVKEREQEEAKIPELQRDAATSGKPLLEAMVDAEDEAFAGSKAKVATAEDRLRMFEDELIKLDDEQVEAHNKHQKRRAAKIGAAKRKLKKERDIAAQAVEAAKAELDDAYSNVYEVFDLDKGELVEYKSIADYRAAKVRQAEKAVAMLDMSDIEEAEKQAILAELAESRARMEATEQEVRLAAEGNSDAHDDIYDALSDGTRSDRDIDVDRKDVPDVDVDMPGEKVKGSGRGRIRGGIAKASGAVKGDYTKKKGGMLNPVNLINMLNPMKSLAGGADDLAGATAKIGMAGAEASGPVAGLMSMFSMSLPQIVVAAAPVVAVIAVIAAVVAVLALNFKKWRATAQKGIDKVKDALKGLWNVVKGPVEDLREALGNMGKSGDKTGNMWKNTGKVLGRVFEMVSGLIKFITPIVSAVMQFVTKSIYVFVQVFRVLMAVFSGDWNDAWQGIQQIWDVIWWGIKKTAVNAFILIWKGASMVVKGIVNALGKLFGALAKIPGVGDHISGWSDAMKDFNSSVDENTKRMSNNADNWIGTDPLKSKKKGKKAAKDVKDGMEEEGKDIQEIPAPEVDPLEAENNGKDAVTAFISAFQSQLQKVVDGWKEAAMDAFEKYSEGLIAGVEKRIKAIDDEVEAETKRAEDLDYLARKDELRQQRRAALLKYHADYDAAVYEGKYDEAKQLTYNHDQDMASIAKDEEETDKDRQQQLTDRTRDEAKKRLEIEKDNLQKVLEVRKDQLQKQLDLMTEYIPKNVAAAQLMHQAIQNKMMEFTNGYGKIGAEQAANWNKGWGDAFNATKKQVAEEAYWSGDAAMKFFAAALGIDIAASDQSSAGGSGAGVGTNTDPGTFHGGWGDKNEFHTGGHVGPANSNAHDIPATLQSGEYVIKRNTVKNLGTDYLDNLNSGGDATPFFHTGGYVSPKATDGMKHAVGNATTGFFKKAADKWTKGKSKMRFGMKRYGVDDYKSALQAAAGSAMPGAANGEVAPGEYASGILPEFMRRFQAWNKEMRGKFSIGSGFRTMAEQAVLYSRWLRRVPDQARAAAPGSSNHNFGLAIDLSPSSTTASERAAGAKYGLRWPMGDESWHVEPNEAKQWREAMRKGNPLGNMGTGAGSTSPSGLVIRAGLVSGGTGTTGGGTTEATPAGPMARILKTIRTLESGGNYTAQNGYSTASGAYQFTNGTWGNYGGYGRAAQAPPAIQDARAASDVRRFLGSYNNDLRAVPGNWYSPAVFASGNWDQGMGAGNPMTMRKYIAKWMGVYDSIKEYHKGGLVIPAMATGGYVAQDGIAQVHQGETVLTKKLTDAMNTGNVGTGDVNIELHFDGGFFGTDRDLEKLQLKLEQDIIPKIQKAKGVTKTTFKGVTK